MPAGMAAAGVSALGSVAGGIASGKGAAKAARISAAETDKELAATKEYQQENEARYQPDITSGNNALAMYNNAIGLGTDPNAAQTALSTFQNSTGYKTTLANDLAATNASAYASGLGQSGAALKALQDRGAADAQDSYQGWLGNLQEPISVGAAGKSALAGVSANALNSTNSATQSAATAASNAALAQAATTSNVFNQLGNLGSYALGSSYTPSALSTIPTSGTAAFPISVMSGYKSGGFGS